MRGLTPTTCALYLPDNDVFEGPPFSSPLLESKDGLTLHSRCQTRQGRRGFGENWISFGSRASGSASCGATSGETGWWSQTGSNRRPHACKARALPTELWPLLRPFGALEGAPLRVSLPVERGEPVLRSPKGEGGMVGPGRLELPTLRLSGVRSNHLSYGPSGGAPSCDKTRPLLEPDGLAIAPERLKERRWARWKEKRRRRRPAPNFECLRIGASRSHEKILEAHP
jgi:hypothetical protein